MNGLSDPADRLAHALISVPRGTWAPLRPRAVCVSSSWTNSSSMNFAIHHRCDGGGLSPRCRACAGEIASDPDRVVYWRSARVADYVSVACLEPSTRSGRRASIQARMAILFAGSARTPVRLGVNQPYDWPMAVAIGSNLGKLIADEAAAHRRLVQARARRPADAVSRNGSGKTTLLGCSPGRRRSTTASSRSRGRHDRPPRPAPTRDRGLTLREYVLTSCAASWSPPKSSSLVWSRRWGRGASDQATLDAYWGQARLEHAMTDTTVAPAHHDQAPRENHEELPRRQLRSRARS